MTTVADGTLNLLFDRVVQNPTIARALDALLASGFFNTL
jgi:hypothetical protein